MRFSNSPPLPSRQQPAANDPSIAAFLSKFEVSIFGADTHETFVGLYHDQNAAWNHAFACAPSPFCGISVRSLP